MKFILLILYSLKYCKKFHLLLHEGSNIFCLCSDFMFLDFNPYSHEGSDTFSCQKFSKSSNFNPHSHEGSDRIEGSIFATLSRFQSTLPRREWLASLADSFHVLSYFNPHSHEGSDAVMSFEDVKMAISIHTPTKGVTVLTYTLCPPVRFQSTLPRREWHAVVANYTALEKISIHTPTKGVTTKRVKQPNLKGRISIHTPTKGVT